MYFLESIILVCLSAFKRTLKFNLHGQVRFSERILEHVRRHQSLIFLSFQNLVRDPLIGSFHKIDFEGDFVTF